LDNIGDEDPDNYILSWADTTDPGNYQQAIVIVSLLNKRDQYRESDCKNTKAWKVYIPEWLYEYGNVFSKTKLERMLLRKPYDHAIEFEKGTIFPKPAKIYPFSILERNSLDLWIDKELRKGYIQPSTSPIAAPFFFVKKHDRSLRLVIDYRVLNGITIKNRYPILQIADLIESLSHASIFIKIDLR